MNAEFLNELKLLMDMQDMKYRELNQKQSYYTWLQTKKPMKSQITAKDEYLILKYLTNVKYEDQSHILTTLMIWLAKHPNSSGRFVFTKCLNLLNCHNNDQLLQNVTISRINSFRGSIRRLSNKITPNVFNKNTIEVSRLEEPRRSVTFNEELVIYSITK